MPKAAQNEPLWYQMTSMQVAQEFQVDLAQGLSTVEAQARLKKYGPNTLSMQQKRLAPIAWVQRHQLAISLTLFGAALFSFLVVFEVDAFLLMVGLTICILCLSIYLEFPAEQSCVQPEARALVRHDGQLTVIHPTSVVPGDIAILTPGSVVPADGRLCISDRLAIDERTLIGASSPVLKEIEVSEAALARPGEHINVAFMSTLVKHGYGTMIVTSTGKKTKIARIKGLQTQIKRDRKPVSKLLWRVRNQMTIEFARLAYLVHSDINISSILRTKVDSNG